MIHLGLIGYPLAHSLSPKIHSAALKECGLEGDYLLFPIAPDDLQGMKSLLDRVRTGEIMGLNVTIPHKQNVISLLDELTDTAKTIGAVNTIYLGDSKFVGENTDAPGFLYDLKKFIGNRELGNGKSALVLGAGGSAKAVIYALANDGWSVTIVARRIEQAQQLVNSFPDYKLQIANSDDLQPLVHSLSLVVNTTPVGMVPDTDQSPLPENLSLPQHVLVYDLVYNPRETKLVKNALSKGLTATSGLGMLIEQASLSFKLWTGRSPKRETMQASVNK